MKKINIILIFVIILILGIVGFIIGINMNDKATLNNIVGTYRTNTWNGKEAVLVLNEDKTCIYPTGSKGIWSVDNGKIYIEIEESYSYADGNLVTKHSKSKIETIIVDKGIMINTHFFEKVK